MGGICMSKCQIPAAIYHGYISVPHKNSTIIAYHHMINTNNNHAEMLSFDFLIPKRLVAKVFV